MKDTLDLLASSDITHPAMKQQLRIALAQGLLSAIYQMITGRPPRTASNFSVEGGVFIAGPAENLDNAQAAINKTIPGLVSDTKDAERPLGPPAIYIQADKLTDGNLKALADMAFHLQQRHTQSGMPPPEQELRSR